MTTSISKVVKPNRWWREIEITKEADLDVIPTSYLSLDSLVAQVRTQQNNLVICQAEVARTEIAVEEAKRALSEALLELDKELCISKTRFTRS